ncbi:hypothetical protein [Nitrosospira sp. Nsp1]|uniref:hypothetical protein n=1 Tax=Nitrosospira sp. Nsp1 TaxID=136547 RepID=UPI000882DA39|nr:hypothetical protein [Nitrosospira sp. Nsp1]SCX40147.1 hypothetical protein SAMN05720354_10357 [Nitrosospira sp. Nsp1]
MNIYLISQYENTGFNTYNTAVVIAESEEAAQLTHPSGEEEWIDESWADPEDIEVELLGEAVEGSRAGVLCASFHTG